MPSGRQSLARDLLLRLLGLGFLTAAALAAGRLFAMVHVPPVHQGSPAEMAWAALSFLSASAGATLVFWGHHIFDRIAIAPR